MYRNQYFISNFKISNIKSDALILSSFNNLNVYSHPSLHITKEKYESTEIMLLGYIIDPLKPDLKDGEIIRDLAKICNTKEMFFRRVQLLSGRFVLLYRNDQDFLAISDASGLRRLCFEFSNEDIILTSSLRMFIDLYGKEPVVSSDKQAYIKMTKLYEQDYEMIGDETMDDRLKIVLANHYLDITKKTVYRTPIYQDEFVNKGETIEYAARVLTGSIEAITKRYKVLQPITAGTDTRTLLAASRNYVDQIYYYVFDTGITIGSKNDIRISQKLSEKLGISFHTIRPGKLRQEFVEAYLREHIYEKVLPSTPEIQYHYYHYSDSNAVRVSGFCGEIGRCRLGYTNKNIDEKILRYFSGYGNKSEYVNRKINSWLNESIEYSKEYDIPLLDLVYWEQSMGKAAYPSNQDIAIEEFSPWCNKNLLLSVMRTDPKKRNFFKSQFHFNLIGFMWPELLSEPFNPVGPIGYVRGIIGRNSLMRYLKIRLKSLS